MKSIENSKSFWLRQIRDVVILALIGIPFSYLVCPECWSDFDVLKYSITISSILWITLSKGNGLVDYLISQRVSWLKEPVKRLLVSLIGHTLFTLAVVLLLKVIFKRQ